MNLPAIRLRLGLLGTCALLMGPVASPTHACLIPWTGGYGYSSYYGPAAGYGHGYAAHYGGYGYTTNYGGGGGGCCLMNLFSGCGLFGHGSYYAGYAPTYQYAPSCSAPCATGCGTYGNCGSCGTWGGYALGGNCGSCLSGDCGIPSVSDPIGSPTPYSGQPVTPPASQGPSSSPPTYAPPQTHPEGGDGGFLQPQPIPGTGNDADRGLLLPETGSSLEAAPSEVAPAGGATPDSQIERDGGIQFDSFKIPARQPQDVESDGDDVEEKAEESRVIEPLQIDAVAAHVTPQRRRAHYRAIFRTPGVARTQVPSHSGWEAVHDVPVLADADR